MVTSLGREVYSLPHSVSEGFGPWKVRSEACVRDVTTVHVTHLSLREDAPSRRSLEHTCGTSYLPHPITSFIIMTHDDSSALPIPMMVIVACIG